jgi:hypothetical protein
VLRHQTPITDRGAAEGRDVSNRLRTLLLAWRIIILGVEMESQARIRAEDWTRVSRINPASSWPHDNFHVTVERVSGLTRSPDGTASSLETLGEPSQRVDRARQVNARSTFKLRDVDPAHISYETTGLFRRLSHRESAEISAAAVELSQLSIILERRIVCCWAQDRSVGATRQRNAGRSNGRVKGDVSADREVSQRVMV